MAPSVCRVVCIAALVGLLNEVLPVPARAPAASAGGGVGRGRRKNAHHRCRQDHVAHSSTGCLTSNTATPAPASDGVGEGGGSRVVGARPAWLVGSGSGRGRGLTRRKKGSSSSQEARAGARASSVVGLRGGSTAAGEGLEEGTAGVVRSMQILVSTTKISSYIDARGEVAARSDWTVGKLKEELEKKFPGKIPASLQRLFKGTQLLPSSMTLEEASEGTEGPLSLLLDNAPPIDASRFDPDTAVPFSKDGQVEAFSACLAAQSTLQETLLAVMRAENSEDDAELSRSVKMKADFENTKALLQRTLDEVPDKTGDEQETFGILHEALRPLAHRHVPLDVNWMQTAQYTIFTYICAQFGATGTIRRLATLMLIPMMLLAQTRAARVGAKMVRNIVAEVPVLTQLFLGLLQAPTQVIISVDTEAYTRGLYGPGGPKYDREFLDEGGDEESEETG
ncbi:unnamed protein product [Ectocarpus sp. 6 AP-2014]